MEHKTKQLTPRETEVLRDISQGMTSKEIAERYGIAKSTVSAHRHSIKLKTGCRNLTEAAVKYNPVTSV